MTIKIEENVTVVNKKKYNRLAIFTTLIVSGLLLIIFGYYFSISSSQNEIQFIIC